MTTPHEPWESLAAGHAFNALEPEDEQAFVAHLRGCDRCRRDLESYEGVGAAMAYAVPPADPPPGLGRRIAEAAAAERPPAAHVTPLQPRRPAWRPTRAALAAAAAMVLVVALGGWNVVLRADGQAKRQAIARRDAAFRCLTTSGTAKARLAAGAEQRASACVGDGRAYVFVDHLDPNDTSKSVYVLWWADEADVMHAVAPFDVPEGGSGLYSMPLPVRSTDVRALAISLEAGRTTPATPSTPVAIGAASA